MINENEKIDMKTFFWNFPCRRIGGKKGKLRQISERAHSHMQVHTASTHTQAQVVGGARMYINSCCVPYLWL